MLIKLAEKEVTVLGNFDPLAQATYQRIEPAAARAKAITRIAFLYKTANLVKLKDTILAGLPQDFVEEIKAFLEHLGAPAAKDVSAEMQLDQ